MEGVFRLYAKKRTKIAFEIFHTIDIAITQVYIFQINSSFAHMASFSRVHLIDTKNLNIYGHFVIL